jgi:hypothetical protein
MTDCRIGITSGFISEYSRVSANELKEYEFPPIPANASTANANWRHHLDELRAYAAAHNGNTNVPHVYKANKQLGLWVRA